MPPSTTAPSKSQTMTHRFPAAWTLPSILPPSRESATYSEAVAQRRSVLRTVTFPVTLPFTTQTPGYALISRFAVSVPLIVFRYGRSAQLTVFFAATGSGVCTDLSFVAHDATKTSSASNRAAAKACLRVSSFLSPPFNCLRLEGVTAGVTAVTRRSYNLDETRGSWEHSSGCSWQGKLRHFDGEPGRFPIGEGGLCRAGARAGCPHSRAGRGTRRSRRALPRLGRAGNRQKPPG